MWTFGTLLNNLDVTHANHKLVYQKEAILVFGEHYHELTEADRQQNFQGFNPDYEKYGEFACQLWLSTSHLSGPQLQPIGETPGPHGLLGGRPPMGVDRGGNRSSPKPWNQGQPMPPSSERE